MQMQHKVLPDVIDRLQTNLTRDKSVESVVSLRGKILALKIARRGNVITRSNSFNQLDGGCGCAMITENYRI